MAIFIHCAKILDRRKSIYFEMSEFDFVPSCNTRVLTLLNKPFFNNVFDYHFLLLANSVFDLPILPIAVIYRCYLEAQKFRENYSLVPKKSSDRKENDTKRFPYLLD